MHVSAQVDALRELVDPGKQAALDQCLIDRAADLGRGGNLDQAEQLLRPLLERPDPPSSCLDLMARICTQQGRLAEAEAFWNRIPAGETGNAEARACLQRVRKAQRLATRLLSPATGVWMIVSAFATLATVICALWFITSSSVKTGLKTALRDMGNQGRLAAAPGAKQQEALDAVARSSADILARQEAEEKSLSDMSAKQQEALDALVRSTAGILAQHEAQGKALADISEKLADVRSVLTAPEAPPPLNFSATGVSTTPLHNSWVIGFDGDAFDGKGIMIWTVRKHIRDLAKAVTASGRNWRVEIVTFPYPARKDRSLARLRGTRIANYLEDTCKLHPADLCLRVGSERELKFISSGSTWRDPSRLLLLRLLASNDSGLP